MTPNTNIPRLILPQNFAKRNKAILKWFRDTDAQLARFAEQGVVRVDLAQTYYKMKVEDNQELSKADKQMLANESKLWKIPTTV